MARPGTRPSTKAPATRGSARKRSPLSETDVARLAELMSLKFGWTPREHQIAGVRAQLEGVNMVIQAATGTGKTAIAAGPHIWPGNSKKVTLMVCPLLTLEEELVSTFDQEFGLRAIAINGTNGSCARATIDDILKLKYQIIILSPEMAQARVFVDRVLRNAVFMRRVVALFVDEAHCISHWGANFRKKYGTLGNVTAFLPRGTPIMAVSATLTPRVRRDIQRVLGFAKSETRFLNLGNDRPNVSLVVRSCHHPLNTFTDLDFFLPQHPRAPTDIPKTYIYVDSVATTHEVAEHLADILEERAAQTRSSHTANANHSTPSHPPSSPSNWREYIRPFNASMSPAYRTRAMEAFRTGAVRVLVCTEAAGMGCNISDVDLVIQWKLPATTSNFVQRIGRAARGRNRHGLAVLLVEKSAFNLGLASGGPRANRKRARATQEDSQEPTDPQANISSQDRKRLKGYAIAHGSERGSQSARDDPPTGAQPPLNVEAADEGLSTFVQSVTCRRALLAQIFESPPATPPTVACCDICDPTLLQVTRPAPPIPTTKAKPLARGEPDPSAQRAFRRWRESVYDREHAIFQYDETAILSDALVDELASVGPLTETNVRRLLFAVWPFWDRHADELLAFATALPISFKPTTGTKNKPKTQAPLTPRSVPNTPPLLDNPYSTTTTPEPTSRPPSTAYDRAGARAAGYLPSSPEPKSRADQAWPAPTTDYTYGPPRVPKRPATSADTLTPRLAKSARIIPPTFPYAPSPQYPSVAGSTGARPTILSSFARLDTAPTRGPPRPPTPRHVYDRPSAARGRVEHARTLPNPTHTLNTPVIGPAFGLHSPRSYGIPNIAHPLHTHAPLSQPLYSMSPTSRPHALSPPSTSASQPMYSSASSAPYLEFGARAYTPTVHPPPRPSHHLARFDGTRMASTVVGYPGHQSQSYDAGSQTTYDSGGSQVSGYSSQDSYVYYPGTSM